MNELISRLTNLLTDQRDVYIKLIGLSEQKKETILNNQVEALDRIVKKEQLLLVELQELERQRKGIMEAVAKLLDCPAGEITIQDILDHCPPSLENNLLYIQKELTTQLQAQVNINEVNRKLLESRLEYISFMMDTANADYTNAYQPNATDVKKTQTNSRIIDLGV